jgi:hypothetical protein
MTAVLNPSVPVKIGGKTRRLKYTLGALKKFQELAAVDIIMSGLQIEELEAEQFRALVFCGLMHEDEKLALKKAGRWVKKSNAVAIVGAVSIALKVALPEAEPKNVDSQQEASEDKTAEDGSTSSPRAEPKPTDWLRLWSIGRYFLGLTEHEVWSLTLAEYVELQKRYLEAEEKNDFRTGIIASDILNLLPRTEQTKNIWYTPGDIFPQYGWGKKKKTAKPMAPEERLEYYRRLNASIGGREVIKDG